MIADNTGDACPNCRELQMAKWYGCTNARACQACGFVEERPVVEPIVEPVVEPAASPPLLHSPLVELALRRFSNLPRSPLNRMKSFYE